MNKKNIDKIMRIIGAVLVFSISIFMFSIFEKDIAIFIRDLKMSRVYEKIDQNNFKIKDLKTKELSLKLKKTNSFDPNNEKDLIEFVRFYRKKQQKKNLVIHFYNKKQESPFAQYIKIKDKQHIEYNKKIGLYKDLSLKVVLFPDNLNYINLKKYN